MALVGLPNNKFFAHKVGNDVIIPHKPGDQPLARKLVLQWHPDKHPQNRDAGASQRMKLRNKGGRNPKSKGASGLRKQNVALPDFVKLGRYPQAVVAFRFRT